MKKIFLKRVCSALALTAVATSTVSMTSFAAIDASPYLEASRNGFTQEEIDASALKPEISVTKEIISLDDAKAAMTRTMEISVSGVDKKYASTGLHIYYDERLTVVPTPVGTPAELGPASKYLTLGEPKEDPTAAEQGLKGFFTCSACSSDNGLDGVIWTFQVTLPADVKEGDVFPIDIFYKSVPGAKDLFTNADDDDEGKLMQAYFFTRSINNGITKSFSATEEETSKCAAIANLDPSTDGYIAIEAAPQTTTTAPVTTVTTPPTTTKPVTTVTKPDTTVTKPVTTVTKPDTTVTKPVTTVTKPDTTVTKPVTTDDVTTTKPVTTKPVTTKPATTAKPAATTTAKTTAGKNDSPKTGVAGVGVAVAGLAVAIGTAFVLRKKED